MIPISLLKCIPSRLTVVRPHSPILEMSIEDFQLPITLGNTILKTTCRLTWTETSNQLQPLKWEETMYQKDHGVHSSTGTQDRAPPSNARAIL